MVARVKNSSRLAGYWARLKAALPKPVAPEGPHSQPARLQCVSDSESSEHGLDVGLGVVAAIALGFLSLLLPSASFELIAAAGLLIVVCGVALAADLRGARGRYLEVAPYLPRRMEPQRWARLQGLWMAMIGAVWFIGSVASLIMGKTPQ